jgi:hypothetical protein
MEPEDEVLPYAYLQDHETLNAIHFQNMSEHVRNWATHDIHLAAVLFLNKIENFVGWYVVKRYQNVMICSLYKVSQRKSG